MPESNANQNLPTILVLPTDPFRRKIDNSTAEERIMADLIATAKCPVTVQAWQPSVFSRMLNNYLPIGTFVVLTDGRVVQILRYADEPRCRPTIEAPNLKLHGCIHAPPNQQQPFVLPMSPILLGILDRELVKSTKIISFFSDDIDDLAFIFLLDDIVKKGHVIHGIENCWFIRYNSNGESLAEPDMFSSFPSGLKEQGFRGFADTPLNIWSSIVLLQQQFRGVMSRYGAKCQGDFHTVGKMKFPFPYEAFMYLIYRLRRKNLSILNSKEKKNVIKPILIPTGLLQATVRVEHSCNSICIENRLDIEAFSAIVGYSPLIGIRARRPRLDNNRRLFVNDKVNYCVGEQSNPQPDSSISGSIKFVRDEVDLLITIEYDTFVYIPDDDIVGKTKECEYDLLNKLIAHQVRYNDLPAAEVAFKYPGNIKVGRRFMFDGRLHRISVLSEQTERIECTVRALTNPVIFTDSHQVSLLVRQQYFGDNINQE
jgi:hypothetical protein